MYKYPGSNAMTFGFWHKDPLVVGQNWYKPAKFHPLKTSEMSRFAITNQNKIQQIFKIWVYFQIFEQSFRNRQML